MSIYSEDSFSLVKKESTKKWTDFRFTSHSEYLMISYACTFTVPNIFRLMTFKDDIFHPNIVQHAVCYLIVGLPFTYMQIVMSQYSQLGVILFKNICPLSNGVGFTMIIISFFWCCYFGIQLGDMILYLLICMESNIYWAKCPPDTESRCWDMNSSCTNSCLSENVETSTYVYWNETFMNKINLSQANLEIGQPIAARLVTMVLGWLVAYGILSTGIDTYKKFIRINCYMIFIFSAIILMVCSIHDGGLNGMSMIFTNVRGDSFFSFTSWVTAVINVIQSLSLARVCHIMYGTFMTPDTPSDLLAIFTVLLNFLVGFAGLLTVHSVFGIIMSATKIGPDDVKFIWKNGMAPSLIIMPEGLALLGVPQLWNAIYFLSCCLITLNNLISQIDTVERAIIDVNPKIILYRYYLLATLCILCITYGFMFSSKEAFPGVIEIYHSVIVQVETLLIFIMSLITFWIYGVQRISDDIHFLRGSQPPRFWKIMWYINPLLMGLCYIHRSFGSGVGQSNFVVHTFFQALVYLILICPIPILTIYELFHFLKMHKLVSIMQPEERWGPPDPEERHLRRLFNPREEIRSRRRDNTCPHSCLIEDIYKQQIVREENILRRIADLDAPEDASSKKIERPKQEKSLDSSSTEFIDD